MNYQEVGSAKKEFKKLLADREIKLLFTRADIRFYKICYKKLLLKDRRVWQNRIVEIEGILKKVEKYRGKEWEVKRGNLAQEAMECDRKMREQEEIKRSIFNNQEKEKDLIKYIKFLQKYIKQKRWKK